uniref:Phosphatidylethanolamine binding protein 4 n=2 Tax=Scleropages formosus TaxID=113540 RepID=A0A8C9U715_SCLFO
MRLLGGLTLFMWAGVLNLRPACGKKTQQEVDTLSDSDAQFCHGGLHVIYPELEVDGCMVVPRTERLREKISVEWGAPRVRLERAEEAKKYTLMMVDPDAPSRNNPSRCHWRHWLMVDILGSDLQKGDIRGSVLSEYRRPTPPSNTGLHRYQFLLFKQQDDRAISLSEEEKSSFGDWDPQAFAQRFGLGSAVAAVQFLTRNAKD